MEEKELDDLLKYNSMWPRPCGWHMRREWCPACEDRFAGPTGLCRACLKAFQLNPKYCLICGSLPHRVEGSICKWCGTKHGPPPEISTIPQGIISPEIL